MNYKKSIILSALSLGFSIGVNAQGPAYSLNGLGRSIITDNDLSGASVDNDETIQKANISGYNLFDLQTNLDLDSTFNAKAILGLGHHLVHLLVQKLTLNLDFSPWEVM